MNERLKQVILGVGSLILGPANVLPQPGLRITLPPENSSIAIARDFGMVGRDLTRELQKKETADQLMLGV